MQATKSGFLALRPYDVEAQTSRPPPGSAPGIVIKEDHIRVIPAKFGQSQVSSLGGNVL